MHNPNVKMTQFNPAQFRNIAALNPTLRLEQIRGIDVTPDGSQITLATTVSGERIADKRALGVYEHGGNHALDSVVEVEGVKLIAGTPGIQVNPAFPAIIEGLKGLFSREDRSVLVCSKPQGTIAYYLYTNQTAQPVDLTSRGLDFVEVAYLPKPRGFVARQAGSNRLHFLTWDQATRGQTDGALWRVSNALPSVKAITALPARIQDSHAVLVQTVEVDGAIASDTLNLAGIVNGEIRSIAREVGTDDVAFRCFASREVAIVEAGAQARNLTPNTTYQVPTQKLPELFGKAGTKLVEAVAAA